MKLILDTLERARLATTDLSLADDLRVAIDELHLVNDGRSLAEISCGADAFEAIQNHLEVNPLAQTDEDDDLSGTLTRLAVWLATLESLAQ